MSMNKETRDKWIAALRSGRYAQGKGMLRDVDNYCCLGVLCDISGLGEWSGNSYVANHDSRAFLLPVVVRDTSGLSEGRMGELSSMNDRGSAFSEIADYIERTL
jgi:hypothetical protein